MKRLIQGAGQFFGRAAFVAIMMSIACLWWWWGSIVWEFFGTKTFDVPSLIKWLFFTAVVPPAILFILFGPHIEPLKPPSSGKKKYLKF